MTVEKSITTVENSAMNQSEILVITRNFLKAWEKSRVQGAIGFGFASHWLEKTGARFLSQSVSVAIAIAQFILERFSNDCRKTKTKAITLTNHKRNEQRDEPITIPSNHL